MTDDSNVDITKGPPDYDKPWVDGWGFNVSDPTLWKQLHDQIVNTTLQHKDDIKVVFLGDSKIARYMSEGKAVWDEYFRKDGYYNYGIRGDSTRQILWRMSHQEFEGLTPKVLVFMIGGNNFKNNYNKGTDEEIIKAMVIIIDKLKEMLPQTEIVIVGQLPRKGSTDKRARNIHQQLKDDYQKKTVTKVHFLDIFDEYLKSNGKQNKQLFIDDGIHLNEDGYRILAKHMTTIIDKLLK
ncbi:platelet-activating factor acetylhydrolase IB subunit alpha2-like isoform X2 [Oppia nitens]|nr:platelet-activating factor acetylhydrolase IB subunit alpha2-like isoform X2 [Oppia nitens]